MVTFGRWIADERKSRGWSIAELSKQSGIPQSTLKDWENGAVKTFYIDQRIVNLAKAFSIKLCEIPFDYIETSNIQ